MLDKKVKAQIKQAMRMAIRNSNKQWMFSCRDCRNCIEETILVPDPDDHKGGKMEVGTGRYECAEGILDIPSQQLLPINLLPECFRFDYGRSLYGKIYDAISKTSIEQHEATHGWGTYVLRVARRANRVGHLMNIRLDNMEKYR